MKKKILIIRLDQIGDYLIFRNFLSILRKSPKFKDYEITFLSNTDYRDIVEFFDKEYIDKYIPIHKRKYRKSSFYRKNIINKLNKENFDIIISPIFSREVTWTENIVSSVRAKEKIGYDGDLTNITGADLSISNKNYTKLIKSTKERKIEFFRNKDFFEEILDEKISLEYPEIDDKKLIILEKNQYKNYAMIFPSANIKFKLWNPLYFAEVADFLAENYGLQVLLSGSKKDKKIIKKVINETKYKNLMIDISGKYKLSEILSLINKAKIIISNDSFPFHASSMMSVKTICISNGSFLGRFVHFPKSVVKDLEFIYPDEIDAIISNNNYELAEAYKYISPLDINNINSDKVINIIKKIL